MESLGHFFGFIGIINSLYILSPDFIDNLVYKINNKNNYADLKIDFDGKYNQSKKGLEKLSKLATPLEELRNNFRFIGLQKNRFDEIYSNGEIEEDSIIRFNFWCLFSCLYCLIILVINGLESYLNYYGLDFELAYTILNFNIFCSFTLFYVIKFTNCTYNRVIIIFLLLFFACILSAVCLSKEACFFPYCDFSINRINTYFAILFTHSALSLVFLKIGIMSFRTNFMLRRIYNGTQAEFNSIINNPDLKIRKK
ncbi:MAG: hypothetical protein IPP79_20615 [Chitinophagaceae bacterium]|nr:hypothetical protein [Chitinophagaceae bacterium]